MMWLRNDDTNASRTQLDKKKTSGGQVVGLSKAKIQLSRPGSSHQRGGEQQLSTAASTTAAAAQSSSSGVHFKEADDGDNKKG
jgi:hypothetical protein